jgi:site-specific recombinase XerC
MLPRNARAVQELPGHSDLVTIMVHGHVLNRGDWGL